MSDPGTAAATPSNADKPTKAIRMVCSFDGDQVTVLSSQSVEMMLPHSDPVEGTDSQKGFWFDLRDAQDRPLYRKVMHNPLRDDVEVFSDKPHEHSVARHTVAKRTGVFVVLVPDTDSGHTVTLSSSPGASTAAAGGLAGMALANQPAQVIARFPLKK